MRYGSLLFAVVFAGFVLYSARANAWAIPLFVALTFYCAVPPYVAWRHLDGRHALRLYFARFAVMTYAMAWFFGLIVARPTHGAFWLVFLGVLAIGGPVVLLGRHHLLDASPKKGAER